MSSVQKEKSPHDATASPFSLEQYTLTLNPSKSLNCQARAAALFVALNREGLIEQCRDFDAFLKLLK